MDLGNVLATWRISSGFPPSGDVKFYVGHNGGGPVLVFTSASSSGFGVQVPSGWSSGDFGCVTALVVDSSGVVQGVFGYLSLKMS